MAPTTTAEKGRACMEFFNELVKKLGDSYEIAPTLGNDESRYLVPKGRSWLVSYYGKPRHSYRVARHWNWYASADRCDDPNYIQCLNSSLPRARKRPEEGAMSVPRYAWQVAAIGDDGKYHPIYGEVYDRYHAKWRWLETTVDDYLGGADPEVLDYAS